MLIWLNGAHGAGKTAVARCIRRLRPGAHLLDPEQIGFALRRITPGGGPLDFKDMPAWRALTVQAALDSAVRAPLVVVPMTVWRGEHFDETVGALRASGVALHHFTLMAAPETLRARLRRRLDWPRSRRWALDQIEPCTAALADARFAIHVGTDGHSAAAIAGEVLLLAEGRGA